MYVVRYDSVWVEELRSVSDPLPVTMGRNVYRWTPGVPVTIVYQVVVPDGEVVVVTSGRSLVSV